jgi:calcium permeable stress-gated cation channel
LLFTYAFTLITLRFIYVNYKRFVRSQQLFSLELVHSIAARTVMVTNLPGHLRGERVLAEYFENMNLPVESVSLCREITSLEELIQTRTKVLLQLENAWVDYVGNPSSVEAYDPSLNIRSDAGPLVDVEPSSLEAQPPRLVVPNRPRPTIKTGWFKKEDAIDFLQQQYQEADEQVRKKRQSGKFRSTHVAFVTFETMSSAVSSDLAL